MFRIGVCVCVTLLLVCVVPALAQQAADQPNEIRCSGPGSTCKAGSIPKFATSGGSAKVNNSIMTQSASTINVSGQVNANTASSPAVSGSTTAPSGTVYGVVGNNKSGSPGNEFGAGVLGLISTTGMSGTGNAFTFGGGGAWGDGGLDSNYGAIGTTDDHAGGIFQNNGPSYYTLFGFNYATGGTGFPFAAFNGDGAGCSIDPLGNLSCTGSKSAVVPINGGKHKVALYAVEAPQNWFEDFGSQQMLGGVAVVQLEAKFAQTINTGVEYHVFLTPNGDCKGLYVAQKNATSFEVRELGGGNSNVTFDYRITAMRKNYEKIRLADHTRDFAIKPDGKVY